MQDSIVSTSYIYEVPKIEKFRSAFNRIIKFLWDIFFIVFVAIVLVAIIYGIYTKRNGNNGYVPIVSAYVIVSPSMVPTINVRDAVIAYRPNVESLKKGDIITFTSTDARYSGLTVTHRILGISKSEDGQIAYQTKGDNNTTPDAALVLGSNIYGKVFFIVPWLGYLQVFLTTTYGWILLVVLPCIVIIISDMIKLIKTLLNSKVPSKMDFRNVEILDSEFVDADKKQNLSSIVENSIIDNEDKISVISLKSDKVNLDDKLENKASINGSVNTCSDSDLIVKVIENDSNIIKSLDIVPVCLDERDNIVIASSFNRYNENSNAENIFINNSIRQSIVIVDNFSRKMLNDSLENIDLINNNLLDVNNNSVNESNDKFVDIDFLECDILDDININENNKEEKEIDNSEIELL